VGVAQAIASASPCSIMWNALATPPLIKALRLVLGRGKKKWSSHETIIKMCGSVLGGGEFLNNAFRNFE
jgi:hypothetical protein